MIKLNDKKTWINWILTADQKYLEKRKRVFWFIFYNVSIDIFEKKNMILKLFIQVKPFSNHLWNSAYELLTITIYVAALLRIFPAYVYITRHTWSHDGVTILRRNLTTLTIIETTAWESRVESSNLFCESISFTHQKTFCEKQCEWQ